MIMVVYLHHRTNASTSHRPKAPVNLESGLKHPFYIKEAHFYEASFIMNGNLIKLARENPYPLSCPVVVSLSSFVKPTVNHPPVHQHPQRYLKSHHVSQISTPVKFPPPEGAFIPLQVSLHASKTSCYAPTPTLL